MAVPAKEEWWFGYECPAALDCGVVLDVRRNCASDAEPLKIACPECNKPLEFRGRWRSDAGGYGSHGDGSNVSRETKP
jgi:hypothetical protein